MRKASRKSNVLDTNADVLRFRCQNEWPRPVGCNETIHLIFSQNLVVEYVVADLLYERGECENRSIQHVKRVHSSPESKGSNSKSRCICIRGSWPTAASALRPVGREPRFPLDSVCRQWPPGSSEGHAACSCQPKEPPCNRSANKKRVIQTPEGPAHLAPKVTISAILCNRRSALKKMVAVSSPDWRFDEFQNFEDVSQAFDPRIKRRNF